MNDRNYAQDLCEVEIWEPSHNPHSVLWSQDGFLAVLSMHSIRLFSMNSAFDFLQFAPRWVRLSGSTTPHGQIANSVSPVNTNSKQLSKLSIESLMKLYHSNLNRNKISSVDDQIEGENKNTSTCCVSFKSIHCSPPIPHCNLTSLFASILTDGSVLFMTPKRHINVRNCYSKDRTTENDIVSYNEYECSTAGIDVLFSISPHSSNNESHDDCNNSSSTKKPLNIRPDGCIAYPTSLENYKVSCLSFLNSVLTFEYPGNNNIIYGVLLATGNCNGTITIWLIYCEQCNNDWIFKRLSILPIEHCSEVTSICLHCVHDCDGDKQIPSKTMGVLVGCNSGYLHSISLDIGVNAGSSSDLFVCNSKLRWMHALYTNSTSKIFTHANAIMHLSVLSSANAGVCDIPLLFAATVGIGKVVIGSLSKNKPCECSASVYQLHASTVSSLEWLKFGADTEAKDNVHGLSIQLITCGFDGNMKLNEISISKGRCDVTSNCALSTDVGCTGMHCELKCVRVTTSNALLKQKNDHGKKVILGMALDPYSKLFALWYIIPGEIRTTRAVQCHVAAQDTHMGLLVASVSAAMPMPAISSDLSGTSEIYQSIGRPLFSDKCSWVTNKTETILMLNNVISMGENLISRDRFTYSSYNSLNLHMLFSIYHSPISISSAPIGSNTDIYPDADAESVLLAIVKMQSGRSMSEKMQYVLLHSVIPAMIDICSSHIAAASISCTDSSGSNALYKQISKLVEILYGLLVMTRGVFVQSKSGDYANYKTLLLEFDIMLYTCRCIRQLLYFEYVVCEAMVEPYVLPTHLKSLVGWWIRNINGMHVGQRDQKKETTQNNNASTNALEESEACSLLFRHYLDLFYFICENILNQKNCLRSTWAIIREQNHVFSACPICAESLEMHKSNFLSYTGSYAVESEVVRGITEENPIVTDLINSYSNKCDCNSCGVTWDCCMYTGAVIDINSSHLECCFCMNICALEVEDQYRSIYCIYCHSILSRTN